MAEKEKIFVSKMKFTGVFKFGDFYQFCYDWLRDETQLIITEKKYSEKIVGDGKNLEIEWNGTRELTDYFKLEVDVKFRILNLKDVEISEGGRKMKMDSGILEMDIKGTLVRDYKGKFEKNWFQKFIRAIYEKGVISARIEQFQEKINSDCDEFLAQAKAYLDLIGKR
jgi:hypothetical protein